MNAISWAMIRIGLFDTNPLTCLEIVLHSETFVAVPFFEVMYEAAISLTFLLKGAFASVPCQLQRLVRQSSIFPQLQDQLFCALQLSS